jgi:uncharacterized protein (DUF983 family)
MNRCPLCGTLNEEGKDFCKSCNHALSLKDQVEKPNRFVEVLFGAIFIIYGLITLIANFIVLDSILFEPLMFILIGAYMIGSSVLLGDYKEKVELMNIEQKQLKDRIEFLEKQANNKS